VICTFGSKLTEHGSDAMAPNTAGDPWELDPIVHRDEDGNLALPDLPQPFITPSGQEVPAVEPPDLELPDQWRADPGLPGITGPT